MKLAFEDEEESKALFDWLLVKDKYFYHSSHVAWPFETPDPLAARVAFLVFALFHVICVPTCGHQVAGRHVAKVMPVEVEVGAGAGAGAATTGGKKRKHVAAVTEAAECDDSEPIVSLSSASHHPVNPVLWNALCDLPSSNFELESHMSNEAAIAQLQKVRQKRMRTQRHHTTVALSTHPPFDPQDLSALTWWPSWCESKLTPAGSVSLPQAAASKGGAGGASRPLPITSPAAQTSAGPSAMEILAAANAATLAKLLSLFENNHLSYDQWTTATTAEGVRFVAAVAALHSSAAGNTGAS